MLSYNGIVLALVLKNKSKIKEIAHETKVDFVFHKSRL